MTTKHVDVRIPASAAADGANADGTLAISGTSTLLFDPGGNGWICRFLMISTDTGMRIVVGIGDQDNQRIRAGTFAANGGAAPTTCVEGPPGSKVYVLHSATGIIDVSADFELVSP